MPRIQSRVTLQAVGFVVSDPGGHKAEGQPGRTGGASIRRDLIQNQVYPQGRWWFEVTRWPKVHDWTRSA